MSRLGRINDEILSVYNTYNTPELHDKILEFLQKDLPDKILICCEIPGVSKENCKINYSNRMFKT